MSRFLLSLLVTTDGGGVDIIPVNGKAYRLLGGLQGGNSADNEYRAGDLSKDKKVVVISKEGGGEQFRSSPRWS
ncbi:hypothetical protein CEXT_686681 [Caerostris extrusa]|uniref:Uncharacterized protein n=1 Tax=Caerostris extrusa TaxID=172846 RepID=A0AAV4QUX0_CAEEX|nr:hypothetical protein CEXT_686681 [Caerostris extrusa]